MPVTPTPTSTPARARMPSAIATHRLADRAVRGDERRGHAEQLGLGLVAVDDDAAFDVAELPGTSVSRDVIRPPVHDSATAMRQPRAASSSPTTSSSARPSVLKTSAPSTPRDVADRASSAVGRRRRDRRAPTGAARSARRGEDRRLNRQRPARPRAVERLQRLLGVRLGPCRRCSTRARRAHVAGARAASGPSTQRLEHRLQLARRPGQQHDDRVAGSIHRPGARAVGCRARARPRGPSPGGG